MWWVPHDCRPSSLDWIFTVNGAVGDCLPDGKWRASAVKFVKKVLRECGRYDFESVRFFAAQDSVSVDGATDVLRELWVEFLELSVVYSPENRCVVRCLHNEK